jgi:hypothetical protein
VAIAAWIEVESASSSHRPHFVHRHQTGTLVATLSIAETGGKPPLFTRRASARITRRIGRDVDQGMVGDLVREVTRQWIASLEDRSIDRLLTRGGKP